MFAFCLNVYYNYVVQQINYEPGQNWKIAALSKIFVCTFFLEKYIMNNYNKILKKLNNKAKNNGDIPVSAIIVHKNKIIARAYNQKYKNNDPFAHAEILAIKKASKKLKTPNLSECEMYVSLFPCPMCCEVIKESKIKKVYYFTKKTKIINDKTKYIKLEDKNSCFSTELSAFFKNKR